VSANLIFPINCSYIAYLEKILSRQSAANTTTTTTTAVTAAANNHLGGNDDYTAVDSDYG
jgi:hypothetical protein